MSRPALAARPTNVPFLEAAAAPANESPEERALRLKSEEEARRISEKIDSEIQAEKERLAAEKAAGRLSLLLLGQSESGKTTLLKQFQLMHAPTTFDEERQCWRAVILLNILNTLRNILTLLRDDSEQSSTSSSLPQELIALESITSDLSAQENIMADQLVGSGQFQRPSSNSSRVYMRRENRAASLSSSSHAARLRHTFSRKSVDARPSTAGGSHAQEQGSAAATPLDPHMEKSMEVVTQLLLAHKTQIKGLWGNKVVQELVATRLQDDWRAFFVNDLDRILTPGYIATDDDILHCRIMTMGITEHTFSIENKSAWRNKTSTVDWHIYDVAGARGQRHAWASYFEDATAIIFMAPLSAFDQYLNEDLAVNRVQDSLELFTRICKNPLLDKTEIVLFFNKMDILEEKLRSGIRVVDYIPSFGTRSNDSATVKKYFGSHFQLVFNENNKHNRALYVHFTSVVDTMATRKIITNVQDSILAAHLKQAKLII